MYWNHNVIVKIITISLVITRLCKYLLINSGKSITKRNIVDDTFCTLFSLITSSLSLSVSVHFFFSPPFPSRYVLWTEWHAYVISIMMMIGFSWSDLKLECFRSRINGYAYIVLQVKFRSFGVFCLHKKWTSFGRYGKSSNHFASDFIQR